ncbi:hypothetical protein NSA25_14760, partial [Erysipelatoclostridium ramosum]|nr:hypothetical protein [Thomasclavelia ramosa]
LPQSLKVGVMAEIFVSSNQGIGKQLYFARAQIDMVSIFAWTIYTCTHVTDSFSSILSYNAYEIIYGYIIRKLLTIKINKKNVIINISGIYFSSLNNILKTIS